MARLTKKEAIERAEDLAKAADERVERKRSQRRKSTSAIPPLPSGSEAKRLKNEVEELQSQLSEARSSSVFTLDPNSVTITKFANRDESFLKDPKFFELVDSIATRGQKIPVLVRKANLTESSTYELCVGRQRLEATKLLELPLLAIETDATDKELAALQVLENLRYSVCYFDEAKSINDFRNETLKNGGSDDNGELSQTEMAKFFGISKAKISRLIAVAEIPQWMREAFLIQKVKKGTRVVNGKEETLYEQKYFPLQSTAEKVVPALRNARSETIENLRQSVADDTCSIIQTATTLKAKVNWLLHKLDGRSAETTDKKSEDIPLVNSQAENVGAIKNNKTQILIKIDKKQFSDTELQTILNGLKGLVQGV